ncbi:MAG: hypothetical protein WCD79_19620 [Chthoniobacteraceae bacterium]
MKRTPTEEEFSKITQAITEGDRVEAINLYISVTECGLTEAQDFIKALTTELKATKPEKFVGRVSKRRFFGIFHALTGIKTGEQHVND